MQPPLPNDGVEMGLCHARGLGVGLHKDEDMACLCTFLSCVLSDVEGVGLGHYLTSSVDISLSTSPWSVFTSATTVLGPILEVLLCSWYCKHSNTTSYVVCHWQESVLCV